MLSLIVTLHISRALEQTDLSDDLRSLPQQSILQRMGGSVLLRLTIKSPGLLDTLHFLEAKDSVKHLTADEIGMNFKDCLIAMGRTPGTTFSIECAGIVVHVRQDYGL